MSLFLCELGELIEILSSGLYYEEKYTISYFNFFIPPPFHPPPPPPFFFMKEGKENKVYQGKSFPNKPDRFFKQQKPKLDKSLFQKFCPFLGFVCQRTPTFHCVTPAMLTLCVTLQMLPSGIQKIIHQLHLLGKCTKDQKSPPCLPICTVTQHGTDPGLGERWVGAERHCSKRAVQTG